MESAFRPYVSEEAWQSMDEANPFDQQEEENDSTAKD
jgi:hypothetical protein